MFDGFKSRCSVALSSHRDEFVAWPDGKERKEIAKRIKDNFIFPNCVAIADGTLFPLVMRPWREDAPDYSGRKHAYSLMMLIVCDDRKLIRYYLLFWIRTSQQRYNKP